MFLPLSSSSTCGNTKSFLQKDWTWKGDKLKFSKREIKVPDQALLQVEL